MGIVTGRLIGRRRLVGMTQQQLATQLGVSVQRIRRWESGKAEPCAAALFNLSSALKVPMHYLLGATANALCTGPLSPDEAQLILDYRARLADGKAICCGCMRDNRRVAELAGTTKTTS